MRKTLLVMAVLLLGLPAAFAWAEYGTWTSMYADPNYNNALIGVSAPDHDNLFAVGVWTNGIDTYKMIWRSTDGGETMEDIYGLRLALTPETLCEMLYITFARTSVEAIGPGEGFFGGSGIDPECLEQFGPEIGQQMACVFACSLTLQPSIWYTDDGGESFEYTQTPPDDNFGTVQMIFMVNDEVGYAGGLDSYLIKTVDGGKNWQALPPLYSPNMYINYLYFLDENEGWMAIGQWEPDDKKDTLSGMELVHYQLHRMRLSADPFYRREYLAGRGDYAPDKMISGAILHTVDGGQTWEMQKQSASEGYDYIFFLDKNTGWIVGDQSTPDGVLAKMYFTDDGGETWTSYLSSLPGEIPGVYGGWMPIGIRFINPTFGMMWGYGAKLISYAPVILYTLDGGETWTIDESVVSFNGGQFALDWVDNTLAYSVGLHLNLIKYEGVNAAPTADAGPDVLTGVGEQAHLDGSGSSDPDGDGLFYRWEWISGLEITLDDPQAVQPTFSAAAEGIAIIQLTVNDGMYDSEPDEVQVNVGPGAGDDDDDDEVDDDDNDNDDDENQDGGDDDDDDDGCGC